MSLLKRWKLWTRVTELRLFSIIDDNSNADIASKNRFKERFLIINYRLNNIRQKKNFESTLAIVVSYISNFRANCDDFANLTPLDWDSLRVVDRTI
jgi:hypothetical protein